MRSHAPPFRRGEAPASPQPKDAAAHPRSAGGAPDIARMEQLGHRFGGAPLPADLQRSMERDLGQPFGDVRIHHVAGLRRAGGDAVAVGSHIGFDTGELRPHTPEGRRLVAHELAHVVHHRSGRSPRRDGGLEAQADRVAEGLGQAGASLMQGASPGSAAQAPTPMFGKTGQRWKNRRSSYKQEWAAHELSSDLAPTESDESEEQDAESAAPDEVGPLYKPGRPRGWAPRPVTAPISNKKRLTLPEPGPRLGITGHPQSTAKKILGNLLRGENPLRADQGRHGRVNWATITHENGRELPSKPYSGRDNPENAVIPLEFEMDPSQGDRHIAREDVERIYLHHQRFADRHYARANTAKNEGLRPSRARPQVNALLHAAQGTGREDEDASEEAERDAPVVTDRLRKVARRRNLRQALKRKRQRDLNRLPTGFGSLNVNAARQAGVRAWKNLGVHAEGEQGLVALDIPGQTQLSQTSGQFVAEGVEAQGRLEISGAKRYAKKHAHRPRHVDPSKRDGATRFLQTLDPGVYEEVNNTADEVPATPARARKVRHKKGAPPNASHGRSGKKGRGGKRRGR